MMKFTPEEQTFIYNRLKQLKGKEETELIAQLSCFRTGVYKLMIKLCRAEKIPPELMHTGLGTLLNWASLKAVIMLDKTRSLPINFFFQKGGKYWQKNILEDLPGGKRRK